MFLLLSIVAFVCLLVTRLYASTSPQVSHVLLTVHSLADTQEAFRLRQFLRTQDRSMSDVDVDNPLHDADPDCVYLCIVNTLVYFVL